MPAPDTRRIRSVAVVGHSHDGKTSLCEALLHTAGATPRRGSPEQGTSLFDTEAEEQQHRMSITLGVAHCDWAEQRINLLDAPGFQDFAGEVAAALLAADGALLVVAAQGSVPVGAELAWEMIAVSHLPAIIVINKLDRETARYEATVDALRASFARRPIAVMLPIGSGEQLVGYVDLVNGTAHRYLADGRSEAMPLPSELDAEVARAHEALVDAAAESDDVLLARYLEEGSLSDEEVRRAIHAAALSGRLVPIVCAAAVDGRGADCVLDSICRYLPDPTERPREAVDARGETVSIGCDPAGPLCAQVFKTTIDNFGKASYFRVLRGRMRADSHPYDPREGMDERFSQLGQPMGRSLVPVAEVVAGDIGVVTKLGHARTGDALCAHDTVVALPPLAVPAAGYSAGLEVADKGDEERAVTGLQRQAEEDPSFSLENDPVTHQLILHGLGDVHLQTVLERLQRRFGVAATLRPPRIAYRETVTATARVQHRHRKQSGGAGLYGDCTLVVEPLPRGQGFQWQDRIVGGAIPHQFRPSVERGAREAAARGALAGFPVVDVSVSLVDGSTHAVDGKDIAFQIAASVALRDAVLQARPVLLEPVMDVHAVVPDSMMGDVIGLVTTRRGRVSGMTPLGDGRSEVMAEVPQAAMFDFPIDLRALTQGRGRYHMTFSHYEEMPAPLAEPLILAHRQEHSEA